MKSVEAENQILRQQLQSLMAEARVNEEKWRRFERLEKQLIASRTLTDLFQVILNGYRSISKTENITLVLADPDFEIRRIVGRENSGLSEVPGLVLLDKLRTDDPSLYLGPFHMDHQLAIFDPWPAECRSMILLPLMRGNELIGSLNLASCEAERFSRESSTDFIERLANILSICLENSLNHERLKHAGFTDPLTGIYNRRYLETRCLEEIANVRRYRTPLTCMFLDIDKFKLINDTFGHPAGDEVLRNVARQIKSQLRSNDVLARYGGEEFVVLLPQTGLGHASEIAERIRSTIALQPSPLIGKEAVPVTISIGIALAFEKSEKEDKDSAHKLLSAADEALYSAKKGGRNRVVCADAEPLPSCPA